MKAGDKFKSKHFKGTVRVDRFLKEKNILKVTVFASPTNHWEENWNLEHTVIGFTRGDYSYLKDGEKDHSRDDDKPNSSVCHPFLGDTI